MTKKDALTIAISALTNDFYKNPNYDGKETTRENIPSSEIVETLQKMAKQLSAPRHVSDAAKETLKAKAKESRANSVAPVLPVIRVAITDTPRTVKEVFAACKEALPEDYNERKIQWILTHELASEVVRVDNGRNPYTYKRA